MAEMTFPARPVFDRAALLERVEGDADLLSAIVDVFLEDAPNAIRAIDVAQAAGDASALRLAAHALKGASASISAEALRAAAHDLEHLAHAGRLTDAPGAVTRVRDELTALVPALEASLGRSSSTCW